MIGTRQFILVVLLLANAYHLLVAVTTLNQGLYAIALQAVFVEEFLFVLACYAARDTDLEVWILRYNTLCGSAFLLASFVLYLSGSSDLAPLLLLCAGLFRYALAVLLWEPVAYLCGIALSLAFVLYDTMRVAASGLTTTAVAFLTTRPLPTVTAALLATLVPALLLVQAVRRSELPVIGPVGPAFLVLGVAFVTWALVGALRGLNWIGTAVILAQGVAAAAFGAAKLGQPAEAEAEARPAAAPPVSERRQDSPQDQGRAGGHLVDEGHKIAA